MRLWRALAGCPERIKGKNYLPDVKVLFLSIYRGYVIGFYVGRDVIEKGGVKNSV